MHSTILKEAPVVKEVLKDIPSVIITMPFQPRLYSRKFLEKYARDVFDKARASFSSDPFSGDTMAIINRLYKQLDALDYQSTKKSIALFLTRSMDRIFYVNLPLEETISVNDSFRMRDLIHHKLRMKNFLVLVVHKDWANTFTGNEESLKLLKTDSPAHLYGYSSGRKPVYKRSHGSARPPANDFLQMVASQFNWMTTAYKLPVFLIGKKQEVNKVYENITVKKNIVQLIYRDADYIDASKIQAHLRPFLHDWHTIWQTYLLQQVEDARVNNKLVTGMNNILSALKESTPELLLIDENLYLPFKHEHREESMSEPFFINDRVDKLIETVISTCADLDFIKPGLLKEEKSLVMVQSSGLTQIQPSREEKANPWMEIF
jgi:hypothetical protein